MAALVADSRGLRPGHRLLTVKMIRDAIEQCGPQTDDGAYVVRPGRVGMELLTGAELEKFRAEVAKDQDARPLHPTKHP